METNDQLRQFVKNKYPDQYRRWLELEQANEEAMHLPKDEIIIRLERMGFRRGAVNALSDTHYCAFPKDKNGEYSLVVQIGDGIYSRSGERSISYDQGVDVYKPFGQILKEGFYTLDEFDLLLDKMERSHWYREKKSTKGRLPVLSILQRNVYEALPSFFTWAQGKEIAIKAGMPSRTAHRFFSNLTLFEKARKGAYVKKIVFAEK
jgi:hypothetical protein